MNLQEAQATYTAMQALKAEVTARLPKTTTEPHHWADEDVEYELSKVHIEHLSAEYRSYIGRGEYDYTYRPINLETLFKD
jgi:hypothetical protein